MNYEELARLHLVNSLFSEVTGHDLYLAAQIKQGIELALEEQVAPELRSGAFYDAAARLLEKHFRARPGHVFTHWRAGCDGGGFDPLWARAELVALFKKLSPHPRATVLVTNLRGAIIGGPGHRFNRRRKGDYAEAVIFIREIAANWSHRRANRLLIFL